MKVNFFNKLLFSSILFWCLFSFKFDIIPEVRVDDLLVMLLSAFALRVFFVNKPLRHFLIHDKAVRVFFAFLLLNLFSALYNAFWGRVDLLQGVLYSIRHFEYFIFLFLGFFLSRYNFNYKKLFVCYLLYVAILIPLQYYNLVPVYSGFSPDRAIANTGGPWELAVLFGFLTLYFLFERKIYWALMSYVVLVLSGSRITLAVVSFLLFVKLMRKASWAEKLVVSGAILMTALIAGMYFELEVINRVLLFFGEDTYQHVLGFFEYSSPVVTSSEFQDLTLADKLSFDLESTDGDKSAFVRFSNWIILIKTVFKSPDSMLIGLGPSFAGKAVDGAYVRLLVEVGVVGLACYSWFLIRVFMALKSDVFLGYVLIIAGSALFIDVFTTYKIMLLFWVLYGDVVYKKITHS